MTYEKAIAELQSIVEALENDDINMDNLLEKVKRAKHLLEFCKGKLRAVDTEVKNIL